MKQFEVEGNTIIIKGNRVSFQHKIDNVKNCNGLHIVLLDIPSDTQFLNNVYAVDDSGRIVWQIQDAGEVYPIKNDIDYVGTRITEDNEVVVTNFYGVTYTVDPTNGRILDRGTTK